MSVGEEVARLAEDVPRVALYTATFDAVEEGRARLLTDDKHTVHASRAIPGWPAQGTRVWVLGVGDSLVMLGNPSGSEWSTVSSVGTGTVVVPVPEGSGELVTYTLQRGQEAQVNDLVRLDHARKVVLGVWPGAGSPTPPPPSDEKPPTRTEQRTAEVHAQWDGTGQANGWWIRGSKLYTRHSGGGPNYATTGYGGAVQALGIDPDAVTDGAVYLSLDKTGSAHQGGTHTLSGPSGVPAPASAFSVQPTNGWLTLPRSVAQALAAGDARGLMFYGGAGTVLHGLGANPGNGRLRLRYNVEV